MYLRKEELKKKNRQKKKNPKKTHPIHIKRIKFRG